MFRKLALVILALATTAAIVSPASARGHGGGRGFHGGGHHRGHFGGHHGRGHRGHFGHRGHHWGRYARYGYGGGYAAYYADSCYRTVDTEDGPRRVYVCD